MTVFVIGNAAVDLSFRLDRLPEPGETRIAAGRRADPGGKGLNQAVAARRAGAAVRFRAAVGDDADGRLVADRLAAEGIAPSDLVLETGATDQSVVLVASDGENAIVSTADRARGLTADAAAAFARAGRPGDVLLLQGNLTLPATRAALEAARGQGVWIILNPAPIWPAADGGVPWPLVDVAVVNRVEARQLAGEPDPKAAATRLRRAGAGAVVVTLGAAGALVAAAGGTDTVAAPVVAAVDTTGAGDTACGVLAAMLAEGRTLAEAVPVAIAAAALSVTRAGALAGMPSAEEIAAIAAGRRSQGALEPEGPGHRAPGR